MANKIQVFVRVSRLPFVSASAMSALVALIWAWTMGHPVDWLNGILALLGVAVLHLAGNALNEYADSTNTDTINKYQTPFSGGSRAVADGVTDLKTVLMISNGLLLVAFILGVIIFFRDRPLVILVGFIGFLTYWLYSGKPVQAMKRGFGEVIILLAYGPLITWGMGYAIEKVFSWQYFLIGIPMGFIVSNILWINQFPDFEADKAINKLNLVVRMGLKKARWGYVALWFLFILSLLGLIIFRIYPWMTIIALLPLLIIIKAIKLVMKEYEGNMALIPAQGATIQTNMMVSVLICIGMILQYFLIK